LNSESDLLPIWSRINRVAERISEMAKVGIVTDSTNCLQAELIQKYDIHVAPFRLILDGKTYRDQIDITPDEFWTMFKSLKKLPTTSAVSPGDYVDIFTGMAKYTDSIVCLTLSQALSALYKSAAIAREMVLAEHPGIKIELIDTKTCVGALGFIVLEAARAAGEGKSFEEVVKTARDMMPRVKYVAAFDTLKYLIRSGRAPKTAVIGELAGVKPITGLVSGSGLVDSLGRERGKEKAVAKLVDLVKDYTDTANPLHVMVHYTDSIEDGEHLRELVASRYNCAELYLTYLTPVMTVYTGPMVALSFYS
jgi:DegV family protein with EDD domain